ncbi:MAG: hypothetical protein IJ935_07255 [Afipia sp.]|nr:hypothetical protein [Afipia sp.]
MGIKAVVAATIALLIIGSAAAEARGGGRSSGGSHSIRGHFRSSGTYVAPSGARNPNRTQFDNYGTRGNYNPYSGRIGTKTPRY